MQTTYFNIAIQISLNYISAGLTAVLTYSMPLFLSLMAHQWIPGERLTPHKMIGIAVGIVGIWFVNRAPKNVAESIDKIRAVPGTKMAPK